MVEIDPKGWLIKQIDFPTGRKLRISSSSSMRRASWAGWTPPGPWSASRKAGPGSSARLGPRRQAGEERLRPPPARRADGQRQRGLPRRPDRGGQGPRGAGPRRGDRRAGPARSATRRPSRSSAPPGTTPRKPTARAGRRCEGLADWKVEDAPKLLEAALKIARRSPCDRRHGAGGPPGEGRTRGPASSRRSTAGTVSPPRCGPRPSAPSPGWPRTIRCSRISSST